MLLRQRQLIERDKYKNILQKTTYLVDFFLYLCFMIKFTDIKENDKSMQMYMCLCIYTKGFR